MTIIPSLVALQPRILTHISPSCAVSRRPRLVGHVASRPLTTPRPLRKLPLCRAQGGEFFNSEIVQNESVQIMKEFDDLNSLMPKYAYFDIEGKRIFLDKMEGIVERLRIFRARANLSDDSMAQEYMSNLNKQLMYMSTNLGAVYDVMESMVKDLRSALEIEEKIVNPEQLKSFQAELARKWAQGGNETQDKLAKNLSMDNIQELMMRDPATLEALVKNPKALKAVTEIASEGPAALERFKDEPALYNALKKLFDL